MPNDSVGHVKTAWDRYESSYNLIRAEVGVFLSQAGLAGTSMILDVPTRLEYMRMIRAEADEMLAFARRNPSSVRLVFDRIYARRNELRLVAQHDAKAVTHVLSRLMTKDRSKYDLLVRAADTLAQEGKLPAVGAGKAARSMPLEQLTPEQLDDVFLKAIDKAGGSRTSITPTRMKLGGAGLLILTVALAGVDIALARDKSFAATKNVSAIAGGAGGAWALAAAGLAVGGPVGGLIGLVVGGIGGSFAAEEVHYSVRGLHSTPEVDRLVDRYYSIFNFDEAGLGRALHIEFLADLESVLISFAHLDEKRSSDADDVAETYIDMAQSICRRYPKGALVDGLKSPLGQHLLSLLQSILDSGWTTGKDYARIGWLKTMMVA